MTVIDYTETTFARRPRLHHKDGLDGPSSEPFGRRNLAGMMGVMISSGVDECLPYTPLEYIETDGNQWIDTGLVASLKLSFEIGVKWKNANGRSVVGEFSMDEYYNGDRVSYRLFAYGGAIYFDCGSQSENGDRFSFYGVGIKSYHDIKFGNKYISIDNVSHEYESNATDIFTTKTIKIGYLSDFDKGDAFCLYYLKIYKDGVLIRDYHPALDEDVACLYDLVEGKYYYNQGTGVFKYPNGESGSSGNSVYVYEMNYDDYTLKKTETVFGTYSGDISSSVEIIVSDDYGGGTISLSYNEEYDYWDCYFDGDGYCYSQGDDVFYMYSYSSGNEVYFGF